MRRRQSGRDEPGQPGSGQAARSPRRSAGMMIAAIVSCAATLALVSGSLYFYARYRAVWDSIKRVDVSGDLNHFRQPPADPAAINILLIGSDSRVGENGKIGGQDPGQRSDTVMVLHVSPGAHRAVVLSFPRDSVVPVYSCTAEKGAPGQAAQPYPASVEQINSTFAYGGPGCLWKTIELTTRIHIDDFVELTFVGFEKVIDDLHGVNVCLPEAVDDPMSGLNLRAGRHHIYGYQALAFWRTREDLGEGSDLQRIQRDQFLMASLLQGIEKSGLLTSTGKLASVIGDAADHMATDEGLDQGRMLSIAEGLRGLTTKSVQFIEVPTQAYLPNPNWVEWTPQASALFSAITHDVKLPSTAPAPPSPAVAADPVSPADVNVQVLNGSGMAGIAAAASADLTRRGFHVVGSGDAPTFSYLNSVIEYSSAADRAAALTLRQQLANVQLMRDRALPPGTVDLILGSSFTGLKAKPRASAPGNLAKTFGGITGSTSICQDSGAFAGPG